MRKVLRGYTPGRFRLELLCMCGGPHRAFIVFGIFLRMKSPVGSHGQLGK